MIYCYVCEKCGKKQSRTMPVSQRNEPILCECGFQLRRDLIAEHGQFRNHPANWPMESDAAGVAPEQIPECRKLDAQMGCPTEYNPETGNPIFTSQQHRKRYCEVHGLYDRNAGYGDRSPSHNMRRRKRRIRA